MAGSVTEVNEEAFQTEVLQSAEAVLVEFWAPWCGPCRRIAPIVEELAEEFAGKLKVVKVNVDDSPTVASNFGIQSIPTLLVFKGGEAVDRIVGAVMKETIKEAVEAHI